MTTDASRFPQESFLIRSKTGNYSRFMTQKYALLRLWRLCKKTLPHQSADQRLEANRSRFLTFVFRTALVPPLVTLG